MRRGKKFFTVKWMKSLIKTQEAKLQRSNNYKGLAHTAKSTTQLKIVLSGRSSEKRDIVNSKL